MKQKLRNVKFALLMGLVLPYLFLSFGVTLLDRYRQQTLPEPAARAETEPGHDKVSLPVRFRTGEEIVTEMDMDAYLVGVVLAEMPASFETEALKAQSCVARTYARKAWVTGGKHGDGSVCGEPACCQGWRREEDYLAAGGTREAVEKVRTAVAATSGWVLTYDGNLIEATYFSCSGGRTEDAVAVWGMEYPYLQSVDSPGEEAAACFTDTKTLSLAEFRETLDLPGDSTALGMTTYTEGGGVHTMVIGGKTFTGTRLRSLLGLRSTAFSMTLGDSEVCITTRGYGHRVGMSQYGADAMALSGSSWQEILSHYYPGTEVTRLS